MGTGYIHHKQRLWKRDHLTWEAGHKVEMCTMFWGCADTIIEPREAGIRLPVHPRANISLSYVCACELEISLWINCQCRSSSRLGEKENANPQECACVLQSTGLIMSARLNRRLPLVDGDVIVHTFVGLLQDMLMVLLLRQLLFAQQEKHCMRLYFIILYSSFITNAHMYLYLIVDMPYAVTCLVLYYEELHSMQESVNQPQPQ